MNPNVRTAFVMGGGLALAAALAVLAGLSRPAPVIAVKRPPAAAPRYAPQQEEVALPAPEPPVIKPPRAPGPEPVPPAPDAEPEAVPTWQCEGDSDGDGLLDEYELRVGLDPKNPDTDGDGLPDEDEATSQGITHFEAQGTMRHP